jgi:hypothetical protein
VGAGHFFLDALLEGLVKFLSMLIAVFVDFFGQLVEGLQAIFRPSTWQVACACIVDQLVTLTGSLGEPRRLAMTMLLVSQLLISTIITNQDTMNGHLLGLVHLFLLIFFLSLPGCTIVDNAKVNECLIRDG